MSTYGHHALPVKENASDEVSSDDFRRLMSSLSFGSAPMSTAQEKNVSINRFSLDRLS